MMVVRAHGQLVPISPDCQPQSHPQAHLEVGWGNDGAQGALNPNLVPRAVWA
jgi:hypothetical protein